MKSVRLFLLLVCVSVNAFAQKMPELIPYKGANGLWGYADSTGAIRISPQFNLCSFFENGSATVYFINTNEEYAAGINQQGKIICCPDSLSQLYPAGNGFFVEEKYDLKQKKEIYTLIDPAGKRFEFPEKTCPDFSMGAFLPWSGRLHTFAEPDFSPFSDGLIAAVKDISDPPTKKHPERIQKVRYGFLDEKGRWAVKPIYEWVINFHEGRCIAYRDSILFVIDKKGKVVTEIKNAGSVYFLDGNDSAPPADDIYFSEGLCPVRIKDGSFILITRDGRIIPEPDCKDIRAFHHGRAVATDRNGGKMYLDRNGKFVSTERFTWLETYSGINALAQNAQGTFLIDSNARTVHFFEGKKYYGNYRFGVINRWPGLNENIAGMEKINNSYFGVAYNRKGEKIPQDTGRIATIMGTNLRYYQDKNGSTLLDGEGRIIFVFKFWNFCDLEKSNYPLLYTEKGYVDIYGRKYWEE